MSFFPGSAAAGVWPKPERAAPSGTPLFSMRRTMLLTVALLLAVTGLALLSIVGVIRRAPLVDQYVAWAACGMLVCLAIVILLLGRYMTQRTLGHIEQQLRRLAREDRLEAVQTSIPDDLKSVMAALCDYVDQVRTRFDALCLQRKELDIQMRLADAERQHSEAVIFSISDAVLVINPFGELVLANTAAERLFNFRLSDGQRRPIERVLEDRSLVTLIKDARTGDEHAVRRQVEYGAVREGRTETFNITLSTLVDAEGRSQGVVAVFHDVTREREIAQIKTDFVSAVSHELRTPLSSIKAYVEMLVDGEAHEEKTRREFYQIIQAETDRLQRLISNVLNISRIESGVMELHRELIQPNAVVRDVCDMILPQASSKGVGLESDPGEALPEIWADRDLIHQAVLNVVGNAIKYTHKGGRVRVRTSVDHGSGHFVIAVADNGMGIRAQDLPRIFDKFYRARESTAVARGTGLGLNLVKHIVETVHQGEISVTSEHGVGTVMVLRLPLLRN